MTAITLTERETKEFVLMHCFGIVPKLIKTPVELLKMLLSLHSRQVRLADDPQLSTSSRTWRKRSP